MSDSSRRIGPYALQNPLARTPAATVWHASRADGKSREPGQVAIRLLERSQDADAQARLNREYQRLSTMGDAQVPAVIAHYSGTGALVMEYLEGVTLADLLQAGRKGVLPINRGTALEIILSLARTLRVAQTSPQPIVHARLTADEVLIRLDGGVVLLGWGGWSPVRWGRSIPPELARREEPDPRTDTWCLGALLASMLAPLPAAEEGWQAALAHISRQWPAAGRLLESTMAPTPAARPATVDPLLPGLLSLSRQAGEVAELTRLASICREWVRQGRPEALGPSAKPEGRTTDPPRPSRAPQRKPGLALGPATFPPEAPLSAPALAPPAEAPRTQRTPLPPATDEQPGRHPTAVPLGPTTCPPLTEEPAEDELTDKVPTTEEWGSPEWSPDELTERMKPNTDAPPLDPGLAMVDPIAEALAAQPSQASPESSAPDDDEPPARGGLRVYSPMEWVAAGAIAVLVVLFIAWILRGC